MPARQLGPVERPRQFGGFNGLDNFSEVQISGLLAFHCDTRP